MLAASTLTQAAAAVMMHGPAFLIPTLHEHEGMSLAKAGLVAAAPTIGVMLTLVAWGWVTDRRGERFVLLAREWRRVALESSAGNAPSVVETGNPYQSPAEG